LGFAFIERGDYQLIHEKNNQLVAKSALASMVKPGMKLEISIVMRWRMADLKKCPRCGYINSQVAGENGWILWSVNPYIQADKEHTRI